MDKLAQSGEGIPPAPSPLAPKHRWGMVILYIIGIIIFLAAFIYFLPTLLGLIYRDGPPPDDSDLRLSVVNVPPDSENAYFDLLLDRPGRPSPYNLLADRILPEIDSSLERFYLKVPWDDEAVENEVLHLNNVQAYEVFSSAARKQKFQDPEFADPAKNDRRRSERMTNSLNAVKRMAQASSLKALYFAKQGKDKEAMETAFDILRVGQKIKESQADLVYYEMGLAMRKRGLDIAQYILASSTLNNADLHQYIQELEQYDKNEDGVVAAIKMEYLKVAQFIDDWVLGRDVADRIEPSYHFQPNNTKKYIAESAMVLLPRLASPCRGGEVFSLESSLDRESWIKSYLRENSRGEFWADVSGYFKSYSGVVMDKCRADIFAMSTKTLFAIKAYKNERGQLPSTLEALVPQYLSAIPIDLSSGEPLKYSQEKKMISPMGFGAYDSVMINF